MSRTPDQPKITIEHGLYIAAFVLALSARMFRLGDAPLNDGEAYWAVQAMQIARGQAIQVGPQPGYVMITALLFSLIEESNSLARLLPTLAGSLLVWLPLALRPAIPATPILRRAGIFVAFAMAIDPALVALSRQAGSSVMALGFCVLALAFMLNRRAIPAGIFTGLAILSGPGLVHGLLGLAFMASIWFATQQSWDILSNATRPNPSWIGQLFLIATLIIVLVGSEFSLALPGLAGLAETLPAYLNNWLTPSGVPTLQLPLALLLYQPLAVIFGLAGAIRAWIPAENDEAGYGRMLSLWLGISIILTMLMPGRQVTDLSWTLIPLWMLAGMELARHTLDPLTQSMSWIKLGAAVLFGFFLVLAGYYLLYLHTMGVQLFLRWAMLGGIGAMALIVALLFGAGWDISVTRFGLVWGCAAVLALWMVSPAWGMAQLRPNGPEELWRNGTAAGQVEELTQTLQDLSSWQYGQFNQLEIVSLVDSPSLHWALRNFPQLKFVTALARDQLPATLITPEDNKDPALTASYRGQDFDWRISPAWNGLLPPDLVRWLYLRQAPASAEKIILWARGDIFPGGTLKP